MKSPLLKDIFFQFSLLILLDICLEFHWQGMVQNYHIRISFVVDMVRPKRWPTNTSAGQNVDKQKRRQTKMSTNQNVGKPKYQQTNTSAGQMPTNQNINNPKLWQTQISADQNVHTPC